MIPDQIQPTEEENANMYMILKKLKRCLKPHMHGKILENY